jgi:hypothetical protein
VLLLSKGASVVTGRSLCCHIYASQQNWDPKVGFKVVSPFSIFHSFFLS